MRFRWGGRGGEFEGGRDEGKERKRAGGQEEWKWGMAVVVVLLGWLYWRSRDALLLRGMRGSYEGGREGG